MEQQTNHKMNKIFQILSFVVQLIPLLIRFLSSLGGKPAPDPEDPQTDPDKDPAPTDFPDPH